MLKKASFMGRMKAVADAGEVLVDDATLSGSATAWDWDEADYMQAILYRPMDDCVLAFRARSLISLA